MTNSGGPEWERFSRRVMAREENEPDWLPSLIFVGVRESCESNEAACRAVDQAIDNLNARMRQGYTSQEGESLRQRWHELKEQRYELGCGR